MKKLIIVLFINTFFIVIAQSQCSPSLKEIYSFDIGDVFQYQGGTSDWSGGTGEAETEVIHEKKTVIEKSISNDSIFYVFECKLYSYYVAPSNAPYDKYREYSDSFKDTLAIIDSTSHYLNACDSELVYIGVENDFYSRIITSEQNGLKEKKVGGFENIFEYNSKDSLVTVYGFEYEQIFIEGLGLKVQSGFLFESGSGLELQGYVKNGDTTGIIWDNQDFLVSIQENSIENHIYVFPTLIPENGIVNIETDAEYNEIKVYSIDGEIQEIEKIGQGQIRINNMIPDIYILTIIFDNYVKTSKLIRQ